MTRFEVKDGKKVKVDESKETKSKEKKKDK